MVCHPLTAAVDACSTPASSQPCHLPKSQRSLAFTACVIGRGTFIRGAFSSHCFPLPFAVLNFRIAVPLQVKDCSRGYSGYRKMSRSASNDDSISFVWAIPDSFSLHLTSLTVFYIPCPVISASWPATTIPRLHRLCVTHAV